MENHFFLDHKDTTYLSITLPLPNPLLFEMYFLQYPVENLLVLYLFLTCLISPLFVFTFFFSSYISLKFSSREKSWRKSSIPFHVSYGYKWKEYYD